MTEELAEFERWLKQMPWAGRNSLFGDRAGLTGSATLQQSRSSAAGLWLAQLL